MANIFRYVFGTTSLHKAAEKQDLRELMLQVQIHSSDVNVKERGMGWTPLHVAADKGFDPGVRELLARDGDPEIRDKDGRTALHIAAERGHIKVVEALLKRGAAINVKDNSGRLPYDYAMQCHHSMIAAILRGPQAAAAPAVPPVTPPQRAMPPVDLPSAASASQLLPPPPPPSLARAPIVRPGGGGAFPRIHHEQAPADSLLPSPPPPPPPRPTAPYPSGPGPYGHQLYGGGDQVAQQSAGSTQAAEQRHVPYQPPPPSPATYLPYPAMPGLQRPPAAGDVLAQGAERTPEPQFQPTRPPPQPQALHQQQQQQQQQPLGPPPYRQPPVPAASGGGGRAAAPTRGSVGTGAADLDWGPSVATGWGDEPEPPPPPPVPSRPNFNPIMSARIQLEKLLGGGLSHLGLGPPRPAGDGGGGSDLRAHAASEASAASVGSSLQSVPSSTTILGGCRTYSYEELQAATGDFSPLNKLGEGGYGPVYRGWLDGIPVAVKVMDTSDGCMQGRGEFEAEVSILSALHHPHVVLLIGSCPDKGMLVYELMPCGSLEAHLFGSGGGDGGGGGSAAAAAGAGGGLLWRDRVRIAAEVASALLFLHSAPTPIVHMDLKPANILLDSHLKAKLGDVGLAKLVPTLARPAGPAATIQARPGGVGPPISTVTDSRLVGTFEYMDPQYMQTAQYSARSDVYALGVVMLQMLTGRPGKQVIPQVEAERRDPLGFGPCIDPRAGAWPLAEAAAFADLALRCTSYSRQDRPDLRSVILPTLMQLTQRTQLYDPAPHPQVRPQQQEQEAVPPMFLCPITQDVMDEPVVAADGYTYEKLAISEWVRRCATSPLTNLRLEHTHLVDNLTLRSAIREWREQKQQQAHKVRHHQQQHQEQHQGQQPWPQAAEGLAAVPAVAGPAAPASARPAVRIDYGGW